MKCVIYGLKLSLSIHVTFCSILIWHQTSPGVRSYVQTNTGLRLATLARSLSLLTSLLPLPVGPNPTQRTMCSQL